MQIKLKRAMGPDEVGVEETCGVCERSFVTRVVEAHVLRHDLGLACPACVGYLGKRNPDAFPTAIERFRWNNVYVAPVYETMEDLERNDWIGTDSHHEAWRGSWIEKGRPVPPEPPKTREEMAHDVVCQLDSAAGEAFAEGSVRLSERIADVLIPFVERELGIQEKGEAPLAAG